MDWSWLAIGIIVGFFGVQWMRTNSLLTRIAATNQIQAEDTRRIANSVHERWEADLELKPYVQEQMEAITAAAVQRKKMHEAAEHKDWVLRMEAEIRAEQIAEEKGFVIDWERTTSPGMSSGPSGESDI